MTHVESNQWESTWEVEFPSSSREELLTALVVRDLLHGSSFDLELDAGGSVVAVDYDVGDEWEDGRARLLVSAQLSGPEDRVAVQDLTEHVLEQVVDEAQGLVSRCELVATTGLSCLLFERVLETEERWDLVIPDWLAPDGAEVPFGFRSVVATTGEPWPTDEQLNAHGRLILVPYDGDAHLFAIPAPTNEDGALPVIQ
jgi:hypothetical protein